MQKNNYSASIAQLNKIEAGIKLKIENQKKINANARATSSNKDNKDNKTYCIHIPGGNDGGGGNNSKHYRDCGTYGNVDS